MFGDAGVERSGWHAAAVLRVEGCVPPPGEAGRLTYPRAKRGHNGVEMGDELSKSGRSRFARRRNRRRAIAMLTAILVTSSLVASTPAAAQRRGGPRGGGSFGPEPTWWGTVDGGYQWSNLVGDPGTGTTWNFDSNWLLRLTIERSVAPRTSIGVAYMYARLPLTAIPRNASSPCQGGCTGDATIARYGVVAHSGGGPGLHLVYEGFLGAAQYGNFAMTGLGSEAFSGLKNTDLAWAISTGAGYGLSNDFALQALFDYGSSLHEKSNDLFQRRTTQHYSIRFGVRVGM